MEALTDLRGLRGIRWECDDKSPWIGRTPAGDECLAYWKGDDCRTGNCHPACDRLEGELGWYPVMRETPRRLQGAATLKSDLSPSRAKLLETMQRVGYGWIKGLPVKAGEPVLDPSPRTVRRVKFSPEDSSRFEPKHRDFQLKGQVVRLFSEFDRLGEGTEVSIEVKDGLPFMMEIED